MKHLLQKKFLLVLMALLISSGSADLFAQKVQETGGTSFWFGIPRCNRSNNETLRGSVNGSSSELFITTREKATVQVFDAQGNLIGSPHKIEANDYKVISVNFSHFEHTVSGKVEKKGIYVESDVPISIVVYIGFHYTGEAYRIVPTDWLGTEYYTLNLYNDYCKMADETIRDLPNQILIVATEDNTKVEYTPKYHIENGARQDELGTIYLNQGETVLLMTEVSKGARQFDHTDLTGTKIVSNKKIAVYSGHTKGTYPRFAPTYYSGLKADFLRNMLFDSMWPDNLIGTEYVTAPYIYNKRVEYQGLIEGELGDLVRVVATKNNTTITEILPDGSPNIVITGLKAGEYYDMNGKDRLDPLVLQTNYPALVGQYGKGYMWWSGATIRPKDGKEYDKDNNELQNPSLAGQGILIASTPVAQWANYSAFLAVNEVNNHFNITFRTKDKDSIYYVAYRTGLKTPITVKYQGRIKEIAGTEYSYLQGDVSAGMHAFEGANDHTTFAVYAYGDMDAYKSGFAYGYPTASNFYTPCNDSIFINETRTCFEVDGTVTAMDLQEDPLCAEIATLNYIQTTRVNAAFQPNYTPGQKTGAFKVIFRDKNQEGKITVRAMTKSGNVVTKTYEYFPEIVKPDITVHNFGTLVVGEAQTQEIILTNAGKKEVYVKRIYLKNARPEFTITSTPTGDFWLQPGESIPVTIQALVVDQDAPSLVEELWVETECLDTRMTVLTVSSGSPDVYTTDINFGVIPITTAKNPRTETFTIENRGNNPAIITGYTRAKNLANFTCTDLDSYSATNPLEILPNQKFTYKVTYDHLNESGIVHIDTLRLISTNTTRTKLYSVWTATPIKGDLTVTSYNWNKQRVIDNYVIQEGLPQRYDGSVTVTNSGTNDVIITKAEIVKTATNESISTGEFSYNALDFTDKLENKLIKSGESIDLKVHFVPTAQKSYDGEIIIYGKYNDVPIQSNRGSLLGDGIQPHVITQDVSFGILNLDDPNDISRTKNVEFEVTNPVLGYDKDLVVTGLKLNIGNEFKIDQNFVMPTTTNPIIVKTGEKLIVPVIFTPLSYSAVGYSDALTIESDVNVNPSPTDYVDIITANLNGNALSTQVSVQDLDFGTQYINHIYGSDNSKFISFTNNSSEGTSLFLTNSISNLFEASNSNTVDYFRIKEIWLDNTTNIIDPYALNVEIAPKQTLFIAYEFLPTAVTNYVAQMKFSYSMAKDDVEYGSAISNIKGAGKNHLAVVEIPKGYEAMPGSFAKLTNGEEKVDIKFYRAANENKPLSEANITYYELDISYGDVTLDKLGKHFHPYYTSNNGTYDYKAAIETNGTMSEGWEILEAKVNNVSNSIHIKMKSNGPALSEGNNNTLLKMKVLGYLSTSNVLIPFKPSMITDANVDKYLTISTIDGDGKILEVCLDNQRLIEFSGTNYAVSNVSPNPVVNTASFTYTTPIETPVLIELYNVTGDKVTTLVNEVKKPGNYEVKIDVNSLGLTSGTYSYKVVMGPYSQVEQLIITK